MNLARIFWSLLAGASLTLTGCKGGERSATDDAAAPKPPVQEAVAEGVFEVAAEKAGASDAAQEPDAKDAAVEEAEAFIPTTMYGPPSL